MSSYVRNIQKAKLKTVTFSFSCPSALKQDAFELKSQAYQRSRVCLRLSILTVKILGIVNIVNHPTSWLVNSLNLVLNRR